MPAPFKVITPNEYTKSDGSKQTRWVTVGTAFPNRQGGYDCSLWCYPLPSARGEVRMLIVPDDSEARRGPPQGQGHQQPQGGGGGFGGTHRDQFRGNAAYAREPGQDDDPGVQYQPPGRDDKLPF